MKFFRLSGIYPIFLIYYVSQIPIIFANQGAFQVVHFLDPSDTATIYYSTWNSDQWINWLREKYEKEAEQKRQSDVEDIGQNNIYQVRGSWVHIVIPVTEEDFKISYDSDSMPAYTDPHKSDYFWSDYAYPVFVIIRSPNATINITSEEATSQEEQDTRKRTVYGYNVYNCAEKKMFVNAKIDTETYDIIHFQTFFPKRVKNPKDKLRIPLSVCTKVSQTRNLLDEITFQLGSTNAV